MSTFVFYLPFLLNLFIVTAADTPPYTPTDHILLSCGTSLNSTLDGRNWMGDYFNKFSPNNLANISSPANATEQDPSVPQVPYLTARIIRSQFSYNFPVSPGKKFLRLYFYPASYTGGFNKTESFFTVTANNYTLLSNFSAFLAVSAEKPQVFYLVKEFIINIVQDNHFLNVIFLPSSNSYAFVNGIEVVSTPDNLYMGTHDLNSNPLKFVNNLNNLFEFDENKTAFETLCRLNVGGNDVSVREDTGMFRKWPRDDFFLFGGDVGNPLSNDTMIVEYTSQTPNYTAPAIVYTTARVMGKYSDKFNLTWIFSVDSGFHYLLRLHFCEMMPYLINSPNQRVFTIFINNRTAEQQADVILWTGGSGIPIFKDFVVLVPNPTGGRPAKQDLFLALHPAKDANPVYLDAILNGLEIFKLNSSDGSLAGTNPELVLDPPSPAVNPGSNRKKSGGRSGIHFAVIGGVVGGVAVILILLGFVISWRRRGGKDFDNNSTNTKSSWAPLSTRSRSTRTSASGGASSLPSDLCRRFLLEEIRSATANFDSNFVIGTGGFGNVYKGFIDSGLTTVAIKRLNPSSNQGAREFQTEIEMLSKLRHHHLVSLIGYCDEKGEMILVYDYMANGTLRDHLYKTQNAPLSWKQRLQICIGAAKGLHYLHTGAKHNIIHRDVKSTNILLDEKWVAKVSDFGLSKLGPSDGLNSHVSTQVKGSFGYVDPEYYKRQQLTDKSDVYSFGVVLFEVLCGRPAIIPNTTKEQVNLAEWSKRCYRKGSVDQIVDANIKGEIAPECLRSYAETAVRCLKDLGIERPGMNDVVWSLEFALQLQEAAEKDEGGGRLPISSLFVLDETTTEDDTNNEFSESSAAAAEAALLKSYSLTTTTATSSGSNNTDDKLKSESIFSEIMNPTGR